MRSLACGLFLMCGLVAPRAGADEVLVFAAASTTDALEEIGRAWKAAGGGEARFSFGSSSLLARQIAAGAGADVFLSADGARMDELERAGLVRRADRRDLLSNQLAVVVPAGAPPGAMAKPEELLRAPRLALADPESVPAGIYARAWLQKRNLWEQVQPRVVPALDVRAALAMVAAERASAGIVYRTDAASSPRVRVAYLVPREETPPIVYPVARLARSRHAAAATAFVTFLGTPAARAIFTKHGFIVP